MMHPGVLWRWLAQSCFVLCLAFPQIVSAAGYVEEGAYFRLFLAPDKKQSIQEVDWQIDGVPAASRLSVGAVSPFARLSPGRHAVSIHQPGQAAPIWRFNIELIPGSALTLAANTLPAAAPLSFVEPLPGGRRQTRLTVYHMDVTGLPIDVLAGKGGRIFSALAPGASATQIVNPVKVELSVARSGQILSTAESELKLEAGRAYSLFFVPEIGRAKRLIVGQDVFPGGARP